ncbi:MAG TPA: hypothetical protein VGC34_18275 [Steroidobacteraceae bacterium]
MRFIHGYGTAETDDQIRRRNIEISQAFSSRLDVANLEAAFVQNVGQGAAVFEMDVADRECAARGAKSVA